MSTFCEYDASQEEESRRGGSGVQNLKPTLC